MRYRCPYLKQGQAVRVFTAAGAEKIVKADAEQVLNLTEAEAAQLRGYDLEPVADYSTRGKHSSGGTVFE